MSRHWIEEFDKRKHQNHMWGIGYFPSIKELDSARPHKVYFVEVSRFTFEFQNLEQIEACKNYYGKKIGGSTMISEKDLYKYGGDHSEVQRWFEKMPKKLNNGHHRLKVLKALEKALNELQ